MKDIPKDLMRDLLERACDDGLQCKLVEHFGVDKFCSKCDVHCESCAERLIDNLYQSTYARHLSVGCKVLAKRSPYESTWEEAVYAGFRASDDGFAGGHYCTDDGGLTLYRTYGEPIAYKWEETKL